MSRFPYGFSPEEDDTRPARLASARPAAVFDFNDPPPARRPRRPLESTTYSIVPGVRTRSTPVPPRSSPRPELLASSAAPADRGAHANDTLSAAQCRTIDATYASLAVRNHYELLGVPYDVRRLALHAALAKILSAFDPDRLRGTRVEAYRRKLEIIVACAKEAYEALADPDLRAAYDECLATHEGRTTG